MGEFNTWINAKYLEFRGDKTGREGTVSEYARWLGIQQPTVWSWLNTDTEPGSIENVTALVGRYGREALEVMALDKALIEEFVNTHGEDLRELVSAWIRLSPDQQEKIMKQIRHENGETSEATASR